MLDESANKFTQQFNLAAFWKWEEHYWERFDTFIEKYKIQKFQFFYFYILFFFFFDSNHSNHQSIVTMKWNDVEMVLCVFFFFLSDLDHSFMALTFVAFKRIEQTIG